MKLSLNAPCTKYFSISENLPSSLAPRGPVTQFDAIELINTGSGNGLLSRQAITRTNIDLISMGFCGIHMWLIREKACEMSL